MVEYRAAGVMVSGPRDCRPAVLPQAAQYGIVHGRGGQQEGKCAMIVPYSTEVHISKWPFGNIAIIGACVICAAALFAGCFPDGLLKLMVLSGWNPAGLIGHQFLHAGILHLAFNMLYLWVFGNAVCEKVGNLVYVGMFLLCGVVAGAVHNLMAGGTAVGASGAINGVIGFYLVLHPINRVNCFYWFFRPGTFAVSGYWLILFWFAVDAWHALAGSETGIAYWAHVGGLLCGLGLGVVALKTGLARMADYDNPTLLDCLAGRKPTPLFSSRQGTRMELLRQAEGSSVAPLDLRSGGRVTRQPHGAAGPVMRSDEATAPPRPVPLSAAPVSSLAPAPAGLATDINMDCPHCAQNLALPAEMIGTTFTCPTCARQIRLEQE